MLKCPFCAWSGCVKCCEGHVAREHRRDLVAVTLEKPRMAKVAKVAKAAQNVSPFFAIDFDSPDCVCRIAS